MRIWNLDSSFPLDPDPTFHFYAGPGPAPHLSYANQ
jgi:hypothetical protein